MMTEFVLDLASCTTGRVYTVRVTQLMRGTHLYKDWTLDTTHFYCPPVTLKWKSDDLFFAWSRELHDGARGPQLSAHSVWQPADKRVTAVSKTVHITLLLPLSGVLCLESVMRDKMCVCVCTDGFQLKLGSQIDFSVFSAPVFGIFDVSQCTCSQNQCLFPLPLFVPLALLSNVFAATAIISMFSSSRLDLCTAILSNTASLWVPRFGVEHCREYCTSKIQAPWSAREVN